MLAATERGKQQEVGTELVAAICKRPDATPASIFPRAVKAGRPCRNGIADDLRYGRQANFSNCAEHRCGAAGVRRQPTREYGVKFMPSRAPLSHVSRDEVALALWLIIKGFAAPAPRQPA